MAFKSGHNQLSPAPSSKTNQCDTPAQGSLGPAENIIFFSFIISGNTGNLIFKDIITSVRQAVSEIRANDSSVNILIAVGHAGFTIDKKIAKLVDGIDIVVGGHTNTFLYTGKGIKRLAYWLLTNLKYDIVC